MRRVARAESSGAGRFIAHRRLAKGGIQAVSAWSTPRRGRRVGLILVACVLAAISAPVLAAPAGAATTTPSLVVDYAPVAPTPGQTITFTAHVTGSSTTPTGIVNWNVYSSVGTQTRAQSTLVAGAGSPST